LNLTVESAKYSFGLHDSKSIRGVVDEALNEEFYCDEFAEILINNELSLADISSFFEAGLKKFKIKIPNEEEATWILIKNYISEIVVDKSSDPLRCLDSLIQNIYWHYDFHSVAKKYVGDSHGIEKLIGIYFEIDDLLGKPGQFIQWLENKRKLDLAREEAVAEAKKCYKNTKIANQVLKRTGCYGGGWREGFYTIESDQAQPA